MILWMVAPKRMRMMLWIYGFTVCESVRRMSWSNNQNGHVEEGNEEPADTRQTARASPSSRDAATSRPQSLFKFPIGPYPSSPNPLKLN